MGRHPQDGGSLASPASTPTPVPSPGSSARGTGVPRPSTRLPPGPLRPRAPDEDALVSSRPFDGVGQVPGECGSGERLGRSRGDRRASSAEPGRSRGASWWALSWRVVQRTAARVSPNRSSAWRARAGWDRLPGIPPRGSGAGNTSGGNSGGGDEPHGDPELERRSSMGQEPEDRTLKVRMERGLGPRKVLLPPAFHSRMARAPGKPRCSGRRPSITRSAMGPGWDDRCRVPGSAHLRWLRKSTPPVPRSSPGPGHQLAHHSSPFSWF